jgi:transcriptional regulator with XRE-family HTH domain
MVHISTEVIGMTAVERLRHKAKLTREQLAKKAGVGLSTVQRLERGWGELNTRSLKRLAKALNVPPGDLLAENGSNFNAS